MLCNMAAYDFFLLEINWRLAKYKIRLVSSSRLLEMRERLRAQDFSRPHPVLRVVLGTEIRLTDLRNLIAREIEMIGNEMRQICREGVRRLADYYRACAQFIRRIRCHVNSVARCRRGDLFRA